MLSCYSTDAARTKPPRTPRQVQASEFSSSEYARTIHGIVAGAPPAVDLDAESRLIALLVDLAEKTLLQSAHDVSDGGLAVTLAESCFGSENLSAQVSLTSQDPDEVALFGERTARVAVSVKPSDLAPVVSLAAQYKVTAIQVGRITRGKFCIELNGKTVVSADVESSLERLGWSFGRPAERKNSVRGDMSNLIQIEDDRFHDHCGVCGVFGHSEAAKLAYLGLYALQHRGQESAGIVSSDGVELHLEKSMGQVADIFRPEVLARLPGDAALGHTRYSTAGDTSLANAQPIVIDCNKGKLALGHNGKPAERVQMAAHARAPRLDLPDYKRYRSDCAYGCSQPCAEPFQRARGCPQSSGWRVFPSLVLTRDELYAARDPRGIPAAGARETGRRPGLWLSVTCAFGSDSVQRMCATWNWRTDRHHPQRNQRIGALRAGKTTATLHFRTRLFLPSR